MYIQIIFKEYLEHSQSLTSYYSPVLIWKMRNMSVSLNCLEKVVSSFWNAVTHRLVSIRKVKKKNKQKRNEIPFWISNIEICVQCVIKHVCHLNGWLVWLVGASVAVVIEICYAFQYMEMLGFWLATNHMLAFNRKWPEYCTSKHFEKWTWKTKAVLYLHKIISMEIFFCSDVQFPLRFLFLSMSKMFSSYSGSTPSLGTDVMNIFFFCFAKTRTQHTKHIHFHNSFTFPSKSIDLQCSVPLSTVDISIMTIINDSHFPFMDFNIQYWISLVFDNGI